MFCFVLFCLQLEVAEGNWRMTISLSPTSFCSNPSTRWYLADILHTRSGYNWALSYVAWLTSVVTTLHTTRSPGLENQLFWKYLSWVFHFMGPHQRSSEIQIQIAPYGVLRNQGIPPLEWILIVSFTFLKSLHYEKNILWPFVTHGEKYLLARYRQVV